MSFVRWSLATALAAMGLAVFGGLLLVPLLIVVDDPVAWLLILLNAALLGALGATWTGTLLSDRRHAVRLTAVLIAAEIAAVLSFLVRFSPLGAYTTVVLPTNLAYVVANGAILGLVAFVIAIDFRDQPRDIKRLRGTTLRLLLGAAVSVPLVLVVGAQVGRVGA